jgi:MFS family permease
VGCGSLGRQFTWLWAAYTVSTVGTWLAFDAFPLIAILVLHASPAQVSLLASAGLAAGAVLAVPLGPWIDSRGKRRVMVAMDLIRFAALATIPAAYLQGWLTFGQLVVVSVITAVADIAFGAASGAFLKLLVRSQDLLAASARFESTMWTATMLGPPLGGAAIGVIGPVATVMADSVSFLLSAAGLRAIRDDQPRPVPAGGARSRPRDLAEGWRFVLAHPVLRRLFFNAVLVNGLILATAPLVAVLMLGRLGVAPWQYGLAFALPCVGGLAGSRAARRISARLGPHRVLRGAGTLRACWSVGLAFIPGGWAGILAVTLIQFGLVTSMGLFNPVFATYRLQHTPPERVARVLSAWSVTSKATVAALTAAWGLLATVAGLRVAIAAAGVVLLTTPLLLPRHPAPAPDAPADNLEGVAASA